MVTDGGFNDATVRRELDLKYPSIMKKPNPVDVVFKDKAKFDVQSPIICSLVAQVQQNKTNEKAILNQLSGASSTKDIELAETLAKLRGEANNNNNNNNNNNDNDNNNNNNYCPLFLSRPPALQTPPPSPPDDDDDDDGENLSKAFPEAKNIFESEHQPKILQKEKITVSNVQSMIKELNEGKLSGQLKFFSGEEKEKKLLKTYTRKKVGVLSKGNEKFLE